MGCTVGKLVDGGGQSSSYFVTILRRLISLRCSHCNSSMRWPHIVTREMGWVVVRSNSWRGEAALMTRLSLVPNLHGNVTLVTPTSRWKLNTSNRNNDRLKKRQDSLEAVLNSWPDWASPSLHSSLPTWGKSKLLTHSLSIQCLYA